MGEHALAVEQFERAIAIEPGHINALCMLGAVLSELGRFDEAALCLRRALAGDDRSSHAHFNLGLVQFEQGDDAGALASFARCRELIRGRPWGEDCLTPLAHEPRPQFSPSAMRVSVLKLRHDCEQLQYLLESGKLPRQFDAVFADHRALLGEMQNSFEDAMLTPFDAGRHPLVARTYKRPIHIAQDVALDGPLINPRLDFRDIEDRYLAARPNVMTVDELLTPEALQALRRFCAESTVWNHVKEGFLGAYTQDGFCSALLLRLARELRQCLPRVIRRFPLQTMWGYKYDSRCPGIGVHADGAAVNVNFWITEDDANLDPASGGLLVYPHEPPREWGFTRSNSDPVAVRDYLESLGSIPMRIPYRANRAVIFDSDLYHATDQLHFKSGYLNRRTNITLLYGVRSAPVL